VYGGNRAGLFVALADSVTAADGSFLVDLSNVDAITEKQIDDRNAATFVKGVREDGLDIRDQVLQEAITGAPVSQQEHDLAKQWMARHMADQEWSRKLLANDPDARRELFLASVILKSDIKIPATSRR
jgi:hypothetical protein